MELTKQQLKELLPKNPYIDHWYNALSVLLPDYEINTPKRIAAFIAQCSHESGGFMVLKENLNYKAASLRKLFGKYFPNDDIANEYASKPNKQEAIANRIYANRMGNGDEASGDGWKYRGRGYIQLTGKQNYSFFDKVVPEDIIANPDLVATKYPLLSAAWFFHKNGLHKLADGGSSEAVVTQITKRVNGGVIGLADRLKHFNEYYNLLK